MTLLLEKIGVMFRPTARPSLFLYLSLRLLQFGATVLSLSYFCSLIGWHNSHYCSKRFYNDQCSPTQQNYARVPTLYIIFVATYCFMFLGAFGLSFRQISSFVSSAITPKDLTGLGGGTNDSGPDGSEVHKAFPIFKLYGRALRSVSNSALLIDLAGLIIVGLCLNEYWTSIIRPNHMYPGSGWTFPVCWLFERTGHMNDYYWKNLSVEKQQCMDNLISLYGTVGVVVFTFLLVVVDAFYVHHDWPAKKVLDDDVLVEHSQKDLLIDITD